MRNTWLIARREFKHYFISPIAYVIAVAVLLIIGALFFADMLAAFSGQYQTPDITIIIIPLSSILLFTAPAFTMRSLAEEQKNGTLELLLTAPVRDWEVVVGKWLGALLFVLTLLAITLFFPILMNRLIQPGIDQGLMMTAYLGLILAAGAWLAIGVMISSFFTNQIAAYFATLAVVIILWGIISLPAQATGAAQASNLLVYLDMRGHFSNFLYGVIEVKDVVYYLSVIALALFFGSAAVETRRWR